MPIRFTSPSLGGHRQVFLRAGEWELGGAYRRLTAKDWFVRDEIRPDLAPNGGPNLFNINTLDLSAAYGVTDRLSLRLSIPISTGRNSRVHGDSVRRRTSATGIGDINLLASYWLLDPISHGNANAAIGVGVKAPSGSNDVVGDLGLRSGVVQHPVHPGIQLGDGGWGILLQAQAYQSIAERLSGYVFGSYQLSPRERTDVLFTPTSSTSFLSVPDIYHARAGLAYAMWPDGGVSSNLGARIDGIPVRDIIGGDEGYRSPGFTLYVDPGLAVTRGRSTFTASIPVRLHGEFRDNLNDREGGPPPAGFNGDLASYLIFLGYAYRF